MKRRRTRCFKWTLGVAGGASALFLIWVAAFGKALARTHFSGVADVVFSVLVMAAASFVAFSFLPYFHGDRRWYSISAMLTVVFFVGAAMLWQVPVPTEALIG